MENSIIIKNLPVGVYVAELCDMFRHLGNILSANVISEDGKQSAFIDFEYTFSAFKAVESMNKFKFRNKLLDVSLCVENQRFKKIFVKNFSLAWDECDLLKAFENIGSIEDVKISEDNGKSNGYGFIVFSNHSTAKRAIECMDGKVIDGQKLIVGRYKSKAERDSLMQNSLEHVQEMLQKSAQRNNLFVKNLPADMKEDELRSLFQRYGEIMSVKVATDERGVSRKFGYVCFKKIEDATKALERLNEYYLKGKKLQISFKEDGQLRKQYLSLKQQEREIKVKQYKQRSQSVPKFLPHPLSYRKI